MRSTPTRARWAEMRIARSPADAPDVSRPGRRASPARAWSVSALETYLDCPFKFFAQHVLQLEEEPDDEEVMDPRRQGQFVHEVFERFFDAWQDARAQRDHAGQSRRRARECSTTVVERALGASADGRSGARADAAARSSAAAGLGEAVLRMEAERPVAVVERLLEHRLDGRVHVRDRRRAARRSRCAARPIASICSRTARSA